MYSRSSLSPTARPSASSASTYFSNSVLPSRAVEWLASWCQIEVQMLSVWGGEGRPRAASLAGEGTRATGPMPRPQGRPAPLATASGAPPAASTPGVSRACQVHRSSTAAQVEAGRPECRRYGTLSVRGPSRAAPMERSVASHRPVPSSFSPGLGVFNLLMVVGLHRVQAHVRIKDGAGARSGSISRCDAYLPGGRCDEGPRAPGGLSP